jgi:hypothetical protein
MKTFRFSGNGESKDFLKDVKGMIVSLKGTSQTVAAAKTLAGWKALIAAATPATCKSIYVDLARGFEEKTTAPEMTTANTGLMEKTNDFAPMFTAWALMSFEDYKTWFEADAKEFDFTMVLSDGSLVYALDTTGKAVGFAGRMFFTHNLPKAGGDGKQKACAFDVMFDNFEEFKYRQVTKPAFRLSELKALAPVGINLEVITPYESTGGTVVVKATKRVTGEPYAGFPLANQYEVVSVSADAGGAVTAISATNAALGLYTLTVLNGAAKLTGPFEIQASTVVSTSVTYVSNVLTVIV